MRVYVVIRAAEYHEDAAVHGIYETYERALLATQEQKQDHIESEPYKIVPVDIDTWHEYGIDLVI